MDITVFIVNYNTCALLEKCLESIFDTKGDLNVEVLIADNNSADGSLEMIRTKFPQVALKCYAENMGFTKAINPLLSRGKGEYYLMLHPDLKLMPGTLKCFLEFFESHPRVGVLGGNLYYPDGTPNSCEVLCPGFKSDLLCFAGRAFGKLPGIRKLVGDFNLVEWSHETTSRVNWVWNACMMIRRGVLEQIGYFDEDFFVWYADWDLCKRATNAGWSVCYVHSAKAIHYERQSPDEAFAAKEEIRYKVDGWHSAAMMIRDRHIFVKKHCGYRSILGIRVIDVVQNMLRLCLILARFLLCRRTLRETSFQVRACLQTIHATLKA